MPTINGMIQIRPETAIALLISGIVGAYAFQRYLIKETLAETPSQQPMAFKGGLFGFTSLCLHSVQMVNHNTKRLRFELPDPNSRSGLSLTCTLLCNPISLPFCPVMLIHLAALLTLHRPAGSLFPVIRPYTPINDLGKINISTVATNFPIAKNGPADEPGYVELLVKKYPDGKASSYLHSLKPGDSLLFGGPIKGYAWKSNEADHINLIAGGSGIAPMYQLIQRILNDLKENTKIKLIFGANADADLVLKAELDAFEKRFPDRLKVVYTVSSPVEGSPFLKGYVTKELLEQQLVRSAKGTEKIFVCGPPSMEASIVGTNGFFHRQKGILEEIGYSRNQIHTF